MWKVGDKVCYKKEGTWAMPNQTMIVTRINEDALWVIRKGGTGKYPVSTPADNLLHISSNPINIIRRMFCRAFEIN